MSRHFFTAPRSPPSTKILTRHFVSGLASRFDVIQFIHKNFTSADASQNASNEPGSGLKVAGSSGSSRKDDGVGIVLSTDKDEDTVRKERDAEAAAKRQQNAMPSWHMQSTITGDLTALGIKERQRIEGLSNGNPIILGPDGYDESLKGLGKVGSTGGTTNGLNGGMQMNGGDGINLKVEDAKPDLDSNPEADCTFSYSLRIPSIMCCTDHDVSATRLRPVLRLSCRVGCSISIADTINFSDR